MAPSMCNHYNISEENIHAIMSGTGNITEIQVSSLPKEGRKEKSPFPLISGKLRAHQLPKVDLRRLRVQGHPRHRERLGLRGRSLCCWPLHSWSGGTHSGDLRLQVIFILFCRFSCNIINFQCHRGLLWPKDELLHRNCDRHALHLPPDPRLLQLRPVCPVQGEYLHLMELKIIINWH